MTEVNLRLRGLVYDPFTQKLYGTSADTNNLLQIDPISGAVTRAFEIGATPSRVELSGGRGIWVGLDGEGAVRRFNLETLTPEEKIVVRAGATIRDIAPAAGDPFTLAVATGLAGEADTTYLIRNGQVLPDTTAMSYVSMLGNFVYGQAGNRVYRAELGANGFQNLTFYTEGTAPARDVEAYDSFVYHTNGRIILIPTLGFIYYIGFVSDEVAINKERDELLYLVKTPSWSLHRFDRGTRVPTGQAAFGQGDANPGPVDLEAWGTNRAAFHSESTLYLLDLDELFLPADLGVSQSAGAESFPFGTNVTVTVTVTNKGPGRALHVVLTNYLETINGSEPAHIRQQPQDIPPIDITSIAPVRTELGPIPVGETRSFTIEFLPGSPGWLTNRVAVSASNESNPQDNSDVFAVLITPPTDGVARLPFAAMDIASDPVTGKLWVLTGRLWSVDPEGPRILLPQAGNSVGGTKLATAPQGETLYVGFHGVAGTHSLYISKVPGGLAISGEGDIIDMVVSPADRELVAVSQSSGTFLARGGTRLPNSITQSGFIAFSADGTKLYRNSSESCDLSVYAVTASGLTLEKTFPSVACAEFTSANGYLYFDNGLIFDPATGARVPNTPVLTPPAFLNPNTAGGFDLFNRTNGVWTVRRFRREGTNFNQFAERAFPSLDAAVVEVTAAGSERIAVRTGTEVLILDLPGDSNAPEATVSRATGETTIRFASAPGARYRIETTEQIKAPQWTTLQDNISGTGSILSHVIQTPDRTRFYRIVRLP